MGRAPSLQTLATSASCSPPARSTSRFCALNNFTNHGKGVEAGFHFAHLDHYKGIDLGGGDGGEEGEGGVGDDGEEGSRGKADQHSQHAAEDWCSLNKEGNINDEQSRP